VTQIKDSIDRLVHAFADARLDAAVSRAGPPSVWESQVQASRTSDSVHEALQALRSQASRIETLERHLLDAQLLRSANVSAPTSVGGSLAQWPPLASPQQGARGAALGSASDIGPAPQVPALTTELSPKPKPKRNTAMTLRQPVTPDVERLVGVVRRPSADLEPVAAARGGQRTPSDVGFTSAMPSQPDSPAGPPAELDHSVVEARRSPVPGLTLQAASQLLGERTAPNTARQNEATQLPSEVLATPIRPSATTSVAATPSAPRGLMVPDDSDSAILHASHVIPVGQLLSAPTADTRASTPEVRHGSPSASSNDDSSSSDDASTSSETSSTAPRRSDRAV
jgi:hypothetical protein